MKTFFTALSLFAFSALLLNPMTVANYPSAKVKEQQQLIAKKEQEINKKISELKTVIQKKNRKTKKANAKYS